MFSDPEFVVPQQLQRRVNYIVDKNGSHKASGLKTQVVVVHRGGFTKRRADSFLREARSRLLRTGKRGAPKTYLAIEFCLRPKHLVRQGLTFEEALWLVYRVVRELGVRDALVGFHGLQDIHILALNFGITGHALRHLFPGRSRPRRVLAAVADRMERELNERRAAAGLPLFETMAQARARKNPLAEKMWSRVAANLPATNRPATIQEILLAVAACGWLPKGGDRLTIRFKKGVPAKSYDWDLVRRNILEALVKLRERSLDCDKTYKRRGARPNRQAGSPEAPAPRPPERDTRQDNGSEKEEDGQMP